MSRAFTSGNAELLLRRKHYKFLETTKKFKMFNYIIPKRLHFTFSPAPKLQIYSPNYVYPCFFPFLDFTDVASLVLSLFEEKVPHRKYLM
jgi:hypothetical protein